MEIGDVVDEMTAARSMFAFMATALHALNSKDNGSLSDQERFGMHELFCHINYHFEVVHEALEAMESKGGGFFPSEESKQCFLGVAPMTAATLLESATVTDDTNLRGALINWRKAWQGACDGVVKAPAGRGFEDHRACYDLAAVLTALGIGMERGGE